MIDSWALRSKVGYRRRGVLRQRNFREGRYWGTYVMAILREEWEEGSRRAGEARGAALMGEASP